MTHKRLHPRKETVARIRVSWQAGGRGLKEWGMVQDKSAGGLGIKFPAPIAVGSVIALAQGFTTNFGIVRHCTKINNQFFLGVEFCELEEGTRPFPRYEQKAEAVATQQEEEKAAAPPAAPPPPEAVPERKVEKPVPVPPPHMPGRYREDFVMMKPTSKV